MIIFDLDGTLWETIDATIKAANEVAYENNIEFDSDRVIKGMGLSFEDNLPNYYPNMDVEKATIYLKEVVKRTIEYVNLNGANLYDNVESVIKELSLKYKLGIITNNNDQYIEAFFKNTNLKEYFSDYIGTASYNITKGEAIKKMIERNSNIKSIYVGDIKRDMDSALSANSEFIHARYGFGSDFSYKYHIDSLEELPDLISVILK